MDDHVETATNYRAYLRKALGEHGVPHFRIAEQVGRSASWLSQVLTGRRRLVPSAAEELCTALGFDERRRLEFLALVELEVGNSAIGRGWAERIDKSLKRPEVHVITPEGLRARLSDWYVGAILELARCEEYVPEATWVAAALRPRVPVDKAREAMDLLQRHGYLDEGYRPVAVEHAGTEQEVQDTTTSAQLAEYHRQALGIAADALHTVPPSDRLFHGGLVALSEPDFLRVKARFSQIVWETLKTAATESPNRVYQVSTTIVPVSIYTDSHEDPRQNTDDSP